MVDRKKDKNVRKHVSTFCISKNVRSEGGRAHILFQIFFITNYLGITQKSPTWYKTYIRRFGKGKRKKMFHCNHRHNTLFFMQQKRLSRINFDEQVFMKNRFFMGKIESAIYSILAVTELEGFTFATVLYLNMSYYTIRLDPDASKICTIIFPRGNTPISVCLWE